MNNEAPLLSIRNLNVHFNNKNNSHVIKDVCLNINRGESVALVGESGSGKSVTAQAIMHLLDSASTQVTGDILFEGISLNLMSEKKLQKIRGKKIGMVFQDPFTSLNPTMKIGAQISETIVHHQQLNKTLAYNKTLELLQKVGISDPKSRFNAYPFQLSGGMRQRVVLAIALACSPMLLIADEPTTALDVTVQAQILELLRNICKTTKMALLLITHDLGVVAGMCNRIVVMKEGQIIEEGCVDDLFHCPSHPYTQSLMTAKHLYEYS